MSELLHLDLLKEGGVLLAFSGGVDSTALFHLLLKHNIAFDIAHVNYHTRSSSDAEEKNAEKLAQQHALQCYTHSCRLGGVNFEHRAREERYKFFGYLMKKHSYRYLLTAHQLNDRLEWLMMQMCRGSGLPEMLGIRSHDRRDDIEILRPLLEWDRDSIEAYLHTHNIPHHIDESNADERYTRNFFRHRYSAPMMRDYRDAIRRSFRYLEEDNESLIEPMDFLSVEELSYAHNPHTFRSLLYGIDRFFKSRGILLTQHDKEALKKGGEHIIARRFALSIEKNYTFIAPYEHTIVMDKGFREKCRALKIGVKLRGYLYGAPKAFEVIRRLKDDLTPLRFD
ncbi:MAG: tRNA lysidine(34) synthetase TilS [Sulfuricurvum sp. GWF2_44_89]|uniref:tRNA(Ile)-lysidine synthase n=1 Tax=Sulfuricurvum kujiense TaxID=148813 RepID=A0A2D3WP96_9BACT|nr:MULTISPECIES: tRNA lysidine(34) synthetase TilS [Sulfuricurvum]OHD78230.1 MAG: tRNA lysidine(34) synthetase TilS [Sulfuricurvum sp. GWF2_44_89]OHD94103.1 MAG: tRNA lysidine(34) synthetase TilS [Sulfuricurvum sp. RIFOXYD2_FULL_44_160]OHD96017.1 MAG: tRNA lysidine(34) synthetase TilS [Sulfuricurvum sp. RIFOXYD12_FULL_44_77]DAB38503.1 MAG TPA: tRNA lysidine(34) synthetase TilS [Sulfuricurvum kujiense]